MLWKYKIGKILYIIVTLVRRSGLTSFSIGSIGYRLLKHKILKGTDSPTVDIEIYNKRKKRDCSETIIN